MNLLDTLLQQLDAGSARRNLLELYYRGEQPLAFLSPEARIAVGNRFGRMASNIPRLAVNSLTERLRVSGFAGEASNVWHDWLANDLDQTAPIAHREALLLGESYVVVWADLNGNPQVSVESPAQMTVLRDPATRQVTAALKRWETKTTTEATLFEPDRVTRLSCPSLGATTTGFRTVDQLDNPFGVVPVVPLTNSDRLLDGGSSEIDDLLPLVDGLNKMLADMLGSSEYTGRPRRWATGIELVEDADGNAVNPIPESNRMIISESTETKFGQLPGGDLGGYGKSVDVLLSQIMAVSALPAHFLGVMSNQPASADALRASEAGLVARAEGKQASFGRAWEQVARLMVAVRTGGDPLAVDARVVWADPSTRSIAQEADAVVKLYQAGLLPATYALTRLGYDADEVSEIRAATRQEQLDKAGVATLTKAIGPTGVNDGPGAAPAAE